MTKQEFIDKVHETAGTDQSKADITSVVEAVFDSIADVVRTEQSFRWHGFGAFETRERPARDGRNPQTGKPMKIKESTTVAFRPASALKDRVGQKGKAKATAKKK
jgi:DNA-binding protein HU-beta